MDEMIKYDGSVLLVSLGGLKTYFVLLSLRYRLLKKWLFQCIICSAQDPRDTSELGLLLVGITKAKSIPSSLLFIKQLQGHTYICRAGPPQVLLQSLALFGSD